MKRHWSLPFRYLIGLLLLSALAAFVYYAREALEPIVVSAFIAYLINPAVMLLTRQTRLKRRTAVNLVYFSSLALLIALPATFTPIFFDELTGVAQALISLLEQARDWLATPLEFAGLNFNLTQVARSIEEVEGMFTAPLPEDAFLLLESTSRGAIWFLVIVVLVYLFLSEWQTMRKWALRLVPAPYKQEVEELYYHVRAVWMAYLRGQILLMVIVGIVFTIAWSILGIPGAFVLGVIAGLFTIIPDVGPAAAVALAMAVALLEGSHWIPLSNGWVMLIVLVVYLVLINIKNMWLRPFIMGRSVHMNEGLIFVAILVATILNGILGALLIVPVLASVVIIVNYLIQRILNQTPSYAEQLTETASEIDEDLIVISQRPRRIKKINRN